MSNESTLIVIDNPSFNTYNRWAAGPTDRPKVVLYSIVESEDSDVKNELDAYMPSISDQDIEYSEDSDYDFVKSMVFTDENDDLYICQYAFNENWSVELAHIMLNLKLKLVKDSDQRYRLVDSDMNYDDADNSMGAETGWKITKWEVKVVEDSSTVDPLEGELMCDVLTWERLSDGLVVTSQHGWKPYRGGN